MNKGFPGISLRIVRKVRLFPAPPETFGARFPRAAPAAPARTLGRFADWFRVRTLLFGASLMAAAGSAKAHVCRGQQWIGQDGSAPDAARPTPRRWRCRVWHLRSRSWPNRRGSVGPLNEHAGEVAISDWGDSGAKMARALAEIVRDRREATTTELLQQIAKA